VGGWIASHDSDGQRRTRTTPGQTARLSRAAPSRSGLDALQAQLFSTQLTTVERLDVPFYLHPRNPIPAWSQIYDGHPWLMGPTWAFAQETAVHALRLMGCGLFDQYPGLKIILGHLGENLPYSMWRIDNRNAWVNEPKIYPATKNFGEYFQNNFYLTTSGNFRTQTLIDALLEVGADRILFSTDWPFENVDHAAHWFDSATISEADRLKIGRTNAIELFNLDL